MNIKINDMEEKEEIFSLPSHIQSEVDDKGFFLYNWITPNDVKSSIEKDFLFIISKIGWILAIIAIFLGLLTYWDISILFISFFIFIGITSILILLYLSFFAIKRSKVLSKNAFVILTNSYISVNGKILKYDEIDKIQKDLKSIEQEFDESLFGESNISKIKLDLTKQIFNQIGKGYVRIGNFLGKEQSFGSKSDFNPLIVAYLIFTLYNFFMLIVYFIGTFFLWVFTLFLNFINKFILKIKGNKVISINNLFNKIDLNSKNLNNQKNILVKNLLKAKNNEWQDALLLNINSGIKVITEESKISVNNSLNLEKKLKNSHYNDFFDFSVYNSWVKKQIYNPLSEIKNILEKNLDTIIKTRIEINSQIKTTQEISFKATLEAQVKRLEMRIEELKISINLIKSYMDKLSV